jgi:hypothetical protein
MIVSAADDPNAGAALWFPNSRRCANIWEQVRLDIRSCNWPHSAAIPDHTMAFDAALPIKTSIVAHLPEHSLARPLARPLSAPAPFRTYEGVALAIGGISVGAVIGVLAFFVTGRVEVWYPLTVALLAYVYAIRLVGLSCRDVFATREFFSVGLFGLHIAALLAWPIIALLCAPNSWLMWIGMPLALAASSLFFLTAHAPASAMYRAGGHVCLIVALGAYQWLWSVMSVSA